MSRSFQASWYSMHSWFEYSRERDSVYCFCCRLFKAPGMAVDPAFTSVGFRDWKQACGRKGGFASNSCSWTHKALALMWQQFKLKIARDTTIGARLIDHAHMNYN